MSAAAVRAVAAAVGTTTVLVAGAAAGGWWWIAAGLGACAAIGGAFDRQLSFGLVLAGLTLVGGVVDAGHGWLVAVITGGTIASIELAALADRTSVVHPTVRHLGRVAQTVPSVTALSLALVVVGGVSEGGPALAPVAAALAALVAIRVIAR